MAFISRQDLLKLVALVVVALFLFEMFAFQGPRTAQQPQLPADTGQNASGAAVGGAAIVDATVLSYGSELAIVNIDAKAQAAIDELKARKLVQYTARRPDGALVLNLERKANMTEVAGLFEGSNATIAATARLKMPSVINFTASATGAQVSAVFQDISLEFSPQVLVGENVTVRINANILDGEVQTYSAYPIAIRVSFGAAARIVSYEPGHFVLFGVKWEDRNFDDAGLRAAFAERYPDGNITILRNSSVIAGTAGLNFSEGYVTAIYLDRIDVNQSFTDKRRAEDDLVQAGVQQLSFPDSQVILEFAGEDANVSFVDAFFKYYVRKDYRNAMLELPAEVSANNRTYALKDRSVGAEVAAGPVGSEVNLTFSGSVFAGKISNVKPEG